MSQPAPPRRRFAPIPIETTYNSYRKGVPTGEPTPDPSPRSTSPPASVSLSPPRRSKTKEAKEHGRRFAPQLVESSRRSRRAGDVGPATKPTDKTDITPYKNHIYAPKLKKRHRKVQSLARRESCDDEIAGHVWDLVARDAEKKLQEVALAAFPNSRARAGGAEHFFVRESGSGSDDDAGSSRSRGRSAVRAAPGTRRSRRDSSEEDVGWAFREMQKHHEQLSRTRGATERISTLDLDKMNIESPPVDPIWTTSRKSSEDSIQPIGETFMPLIPRDPLPTIGERATTASTAQSADEDDDSPGIRPIGETFMPYIPSAPPGQSADMPYAPSSTSQLPPEVGFRNRGGYGGHGPFGGYGYGYGGGGGGGWAAAAANRDMAAERERYKLRSRASPPMLGADLTFRQCPSPKQTKLETDHLWPLRGSAEDAHRDKTGQAGLWQGYCYSPEMKEAIAPVERPAMIATPHPPGSPGDPFAFAFGTDPAGTVVMSEEPSSTLAPHSAGMPSGTLSAQPFSAMRHRSRHGEAKGLHMLMGLDERLRREKAAAELEEKIAAEFTDSFVTQVYNYLSLGYPAMARAYDEELSKISRIPVADLEADDDVVMDGIGSAQGHIAMEDGEAGGDPGSDSGSTTSNKCPRWKALKEYIFEWARQHPDLDSISPLVWGVQERRGSWGI